MKPVAASDDSQLLPPGGVHIRPRTHQPSARCVLAHSCRTCLRLLNPQIAVQFLFRDPFVTDARNRLEQSPLNQPEHGFVVNLQQAGHFIGGINFHTSPTFWAWRLRTIRARSRTRSCSAWRILRKPTWQKRTARPENGRVVRGRPF